MKDRILMRIKKIRKRIMARIRLRKIEKAIGIRLTKRQRKTALNPDVPDMSSWGRGSGKTVTACIWTLMWREKPIRMKYELMKIGRDLDDDCLNEWMQGFRFEERKRAIPDPDAYRYNWIRFKHTWKLLFEYRRRCVEKKIRVFYLDGRR